MQYFLSPLLGLFIFIPGSMVAAEGSLTQQEGHEYPAEFVQSYNQECIQASIEEGLAEAEAKRLCSCTINEFERQYSLEEFQQLTTASATDKASETTLVEVGQFCFEQILYEEQI